MSDRQQPSIHEALKEVSLSSLAEMHFCRPGIIESFDGTLAEVTPAIMRKVYEDNVPKYVKLPLIVRVPIAVPFSSTAGLLLTVPIRTGDQCLLLFADRELDNFIEKGEVVPPETVGANNKYSLPRMHDLSDAVCLPGITLVTNAVPNWNNENIELRDRSRAKYVSVGASGVEYSDGIATTTMRNGRVQTYAPNGFYVDAPNVFINDSTGNASITGTWRAQELQTTAGFNANTHRHSGVQSGSSNTGTFV